MLNENNVKRHNKTKITQDHNDATDVPRGKSLKRCNEMERGVRRRNEM